MQSRTDPNGLRLRTTRSALIHESLLQHGLVETELLTRRLDIVGGNMAETGWAFDDPWPTMEYALEAASVVAGEPER